MARAWPKAKTQASQTALAPGTDTRVTLMKYDVHCPMLDRLTLSDSENKAFGCQIQGSTTHCDEI